jgi:hypothetical protein
MNNKNGAANQTFDNNGQFLFCYILYSNYK